MRSCWSLQLQAGCYSGFCKQTLQHKLTCKHAWPALLVLAHRKYISVWIFEPGNFVARRRGPDTAFSILDERIFLEGDAAIGEPRYDIFDI
jgi:hypothetical protein